MLRNTQKWNRKNGTNFNGEGGSGAGWRVAVVVGDGRWLVVGWWVVGGCLCGLWLFGWVVYGMW